MKPARLHILLLNHVSRMSGAEQGLLDLVEGLDPARFRVTVALPPPRGELAERVSGSGATCVSIPMIRFVRTRRPWLLARYAVSLVLGVMRLARVIRRERVDIVHANSNTAQLYAGPAARLAGVPGIWHSRDLVPLGRLGRRLGRQCRACIAISRCVAANLSDSVAAEKLRMIYNGIDTARFAPRNRDARLRADLGVPADAFLVAAAGQLVPWKRHDLFIRAAARIAAAVPRARFLLVGADLFEDHPGYARELHALAEELGVAERFVFTGHRNDMVALLNEVDLLVHATAREPFGRVVAEAMSVGRPVVAVNACGTSELIEDGVSGILVAPDDEEDLAQAAVRLACDPDVARRIGEAARSRIVDTFDRGTFTQSIMALYEDLATCTSA